MQVYLTQVNEVDAVAGSVSGEDRSIGGADHRRDFIFEDVR